MSKILVKFLEAGRWGDHPADPLFDVAEGEERHVSAELANTAIMAGKAVFMPPEVEADPEPAPKAGPKKKAEGKSVKKKAEGK